MAEYELPNGYVLTDDEIEHRAKEWEDGTWGGHCFFNVDTSAIDWGGVCYVTVEADILVGRF